MPDSARRRPARAIAGHGCRRPAGRNWEHG